MKEPRSAGSNATILCLLTIALSGQIARAQSAGAVTQPSTKTQTDPPAGFAKLIPLWRSAAPLATGTTDADVPKLFSYPAPGPGTHTAVIVMPGGGYTHLVMEKEGASEARWLNAHGVSAFVLQYRLSPAYHFPAPMLDGARAVRYVRAHASELLVDPGRVGVWGFSAGGHLGGYLAAVHDAGHPDSPDPVERVSDRPDFAILSYGRFTLTDEVPRPAATVAAPGMEAVLAATTTQLDVTSRVTADTSPCFLYATSADQTVDARNATTLYNALKTNNVPAELHVFEVGPHGTGMGEHLAPALEELTIYPTLIVHWMRQNQWMPSQQ